MIFKVNDKGFIIGVVDCDDNVVIPSMINGVTITGIGTNAFWNCSNLKDVTIPSNITTIGVGAFSNCKELINITIVLARKPTALAVG